MSYVGPAPERLVGYGTCTVWRGNGAVAKVGVGAASEAHVLSARVGSLPIATPALIAEGPAWVVMSEVANDPTPWSEPDLMALLVDLAALHDRFDAVDPARAGPLPIGARRVVDRLRAYGRRDRVTLPAALIDALDDPEPLLAVLDTEPRTLVHGDPYPQNVLRPTASTRVWVDWEDALVGPAALDLAAFFGNGPWLLGRSLPRDQCLDVYGRALVVHRPSLERSFDAALLVWTLSQNLDALSDERGPEAFDAFIAERMAALDHLGI
jgi:Phosphotransferase enzyme family